MIHHTRHPAHIVATLLAAGCMASPASAQMFVDVTTSAGITHLQVTPGSTPPGPAFMSGGVAAADFDNDGWTDLIFTRINDTLIYYRNRGDGTFEARTAAAGFTQVGNTNGIVSGDIDNDGDADLYVTTCAGTRNHLFINDGSGFFVDAGTAVVAALANGIPRNGQGATFGDYDNDGWLDLMTGDWGNPVANSQSRLLRNRGAAQPGLFDDVTVAAGLHVYRKPDTFRFTPQFVDIDRDGHLDLAIAADFDTSQLFWNNGDGTFTDGTLPAGVGTDHNGMGSTFGDYDGDGDLDWFITNITEDPNLPPTGFGGWNRLYRYDGNRQFTDTTQPAGVRDCRWGWGTTFFDYDNDGDLDLAATNGFNGAGWIDDRTFLWRNSGGVFTDVSDAEGITDRGLGRGLVHLDYDRDGDLDLVVVNHPATAVLYRNDGGATLDYLRVEAQGTHSNRDAIGALLTMTPDVTQPAQRRVWAIDGGSSFLSQSERAAHFGLGASDGTVDLLKIEWPRGRVEYFSGLAANQTVPIIEATTPTAPCASLSAPVALAIVAECLAGPQVATPICLLGAAADCDADGDVDLAEFATWQTALSGS